MNSISKEQLYKINLWHEYGMLEDKLLRFLDEYWIDSIGNNGMEKNHIVIEKILQGFNEKTVEYLIEKYKKLNKNNNTKELDNLEQLCYTIYEMEIK